jgi:adenosylcobyric acid synthase
MKTKALMILGTGSSVGKSLIVAGLLRYFASKGIKCAPFKSQNMSLNSVVIKSGHEIARAQVAQAFAAKTEPSVFMNPILLKPLGDATSELIVMGQPVGHFKISEYYKMKTKLLTTIIDAFNELTKLYDLIILEGAGSPAEINLMSHDLANTLLLKELKVPALLIGDIDKGGIFASFYGTLALLNEDIKTLIKGFVINKFRGDKEILKPGLKMIYELSKVPVIGVVPYLTNTAFDSEDSLSNEDMFLRQKLPLNDCLKVSVIKTPKISNVSDFDPLIFEHSLSVNLTSSLDLAFQSDLIIIPGSKATVSDLNWLKLNKIESWLNDYKKSEKVLMGICGGYQMLGKEIIGDFESKSQWQAGLGLLDHITVFTNKKTLAYRVGKAKGEKLTGYEIRYGLSQQNSAPWIELEDQGASEGNHRDNCYGTAIHGIFDSDEFRRVFLKEIADQNKKVFEANKISFFEAKNNELNYLAQVIASCCEINFIEDLIMEASL